MLEYAYYSVISPEGCAGILWHDGSRAQDAASALRLTSKDLAKLGVVDEVVPEPLGAAHREPETMVATLRDTLVRHLDELVAMDPAARMQARFDRLRNLGNGIEPLDEVAPPGPEMLPAKASVGTDGAEGKKKGSQKGGGKSKPKAKKREARK